MINSEFEKLIRNFLDCYKIGVKSFNFEFNNKIPVIQLNDSSEIVQGLRNLIVRVSQPENPEFEALQDEWVEFVLINSGNSESATILKSLNDYLEDKVFFVGNELGPIDILIYFLIYSYISKLNYHEKEKYKHTSRWFNHIQHNKIVKLNKPIIQFSQCCLYG